MLAGGRRHPRGLSYTRRQSGVQATRFWGGGRAGKEVEAKRGGGRRSGARPGRRSDGQLRAGRPERAGLPQVRQHNDGRKRLTLDGVLLGRWLRPAPRLLHFLHRTCNLLAEHLHESLALARDLRLVLHRCRQGRCVRGPACRPAGLRAPPPGLQQLKGAGLHALPPGLWQGEEAPRPAHQPRASRSSRGPCGWRTAGTWGCGRGVRGAP
jgi:hypothetical protein